MFGVRYLGSTKHRWISSPVLSEIRRMKSGSEVGKPDSKIGETKPVSASEDLSDLLRSDVSINKQRLQAFHRAHARLFGLSKEEWVRKRDLLLRAGASESEAGKIALYLPAALGFSLSRLQDLVKLCNQYDISLSRILRRDPLVVSLPRNLVRMRTVLCLHALYAKG